MKIGKKTRNNPLPFQACLLGRDLWVVVLKAQTCLKNNCLEIFSEWDSWAFLEGLDRTWKFGDGPSTGPLSLEGPVGKKSGFYRWELRMCIYLWILFGMYVPVMYVVSSNFAVAAFFFFLHFLSLCEKEKSVPYVSLSDNWLVFKKCCTLRKLWLAI